MEYFANEYCTGAIVATGTYTQPQIVYQYIKTEENAPVKMINREIITAAVDVGNVIASDQEINFIGSGVTSSVKSGKTVWHIIYNGGSTDLTVDSKSGTTQGGLLLLNGDLLELMPINSSATSFNVNSRYVR
jgi:hypothetical protein